jgi:hypothetical protein
LTQLFETLQLSGVVTAHQAAMSANDSERTPLAPHEDRAGSRLAAANKQDLNLSDLIERNISNALTTKIQN